MKASINDLILNVSSEKMIEKHQASDADVFTDRDEMYAAISDRFIGITDDHHAEIHVTTNGLGNLSDCEGNVIGYLYESYTDSGSIDYYHTILMF